MVDVDESTMRDEEAVERERLRSYTTIGTILLAVVVIIVVLLFWRTCAADERTSVARGGGGVVDVLPDRAAEPGDIAVWLMPGTSIEDVISRYDLESAEVTAFGQGTYVISIGERDGAWLVERMQQDASLFDAGFVYSER